MGKNMKNIICGFVVTLMMAVSFTGCSDESKIANAISKGETYLDSEDFDKALESYEKALKIDKKNIDAEYGKLKSLVALEDDDLIDEYENALEIIENLSKSDLKENMNTVASIYAMATSVYEDDLEAAVKVLEQGNEVISGKKNIVKALGTAYDSLAKQQLKKSKYSECIETCKKYKEFDSDAEVGEYISEASEGLAKQYADNNDVAGLLELIAEYPRLDISPYVTVIANGYLNDGNYDALFALYDEYPEIANDPAIEAALSDLMVERAYLLDVKECMSLAYRYMNNANWEGMHSLDGSDLASAVAEPITDYIVCTPDGEIDNNLTGAGVAMYRFYSISTNSFEGTGYYFVFGDFVNGKREGKYTYFCNQNGFYMYGNADYSNNMMNGTYTEFDSERISGDSHYTNAFTCEVTNGVYNGIGYKEITVDGVKYSGECSFSNGQPEDAISKLSNDIRYNAFTDAFFELSSLVDRTIYCFMVDMESTNYNGPFEGRYWYSYLMNESSLLPLGYKKN